MAKKPVLTAAEAAKMIPDGATVMCGGFLACGQARAIVKELVKLGTKDLTLIANDMGRAVHGEGHERDADRGGAGRQQVHGVPFTAPGAPQAGALPAI